MKKQNIVWMNLRLAIVAVVVAFAFGLAACGRKEPPVDAAKEKPTTETAAKEKEALATAIDAYVYAYPIIR